VPSAKPFDLETWLLATASPIPIVQAGAPVLRRRAQPVDPATFKTAAWSTFLERMVDTMRAAPGVGLAAPQIGVPLRVFVAEDREEHIATLSLEVQRSRQRVPLPLVVVANPELRLGGSGLTFYEGCLSVRGYGALVERAAEAEVTGLDAAGRPIALRLVGWPARIVQHEIDHLDGSLYVDRMVSRSFASAEHLGALGQRAPNEVMTEIDRE
jgi:peptide deformylase